MSEVFYAGIDDGFALTKIVWIGPGMERPQQLSFPTRAAMGQHNRSMDGKPVNAYMSEGKTMTIEPLGDSLESRRQMPSYAESDMNRMVVYHALTLAGLAGKSVHVCTGLPYTDFWGHNAGQNERLIAAKIVNLSKPVRSLRDDQPVRILSNMVFSEGLGAACDHMLNEKNAWHNHVKGLWTIVDIGGNTTDIVTLSGKGAAFELANQESETYSRGILHAADRLGKIIKRRWQLEDGEEIGALQEALKSGALMFQGDYRDVRPEVAEVLDEVTNDVIDVIRKTVRSINRLSKLFFVGGGAVLLPKLKQVFPQAIVVDDPEFANARGFLKVARNQAKAAA